LGFENCATASSPGPNRVLATRAALDRHPVENVGLRVEVHDVVEKSIVGGCTNTISPQVSTDANVSAAWRHSAFPPSGTNAFGTAAPRQRAGPGHHEDGGELGGGIGFTPGG